MLPKTQRVGRNASSIILSYEGEINDQIIKTVEYAASVWESYILNSVNLYIKIRMANIVEDIHTSVRYMQNNGVMLPTALDAYKKHEYKREHTNPDGIITISNQTNWDFSLGENLSSDGVNLAYGIMRSIARIMGFGSNIIIDENGNYKFSDKRYHSVFNGLVKNSAGKTLTELGVNGGRPSDELKNYIEDSSQSFWVYTATDKFKLSSPPYTANCPPFVYLDDEESLMRSNLLIGDYILSIDAATQSIVDELGWNTHIPAKINITSEDVPDSGLTSAYKSHKFSIEKGSYTISNPMWILSMPLSDGTTEYLQLSDNSLSCTITPISDESRYKINQDGYIKATLDFSCTINGKEEKALPFKIYFELKPYVEYATIDKIVENTPFDSYDAYYKVKYRGTDKIKITVEEEFSPEIRVTDISEPYIAQGVADHISDSFHAWIDFTAENEYGKSIYTIELQPGGVIDQQKHTPIIQNSGINKISDTSESYELYDLHGYHIGTVASRNEIEEFPYNGIIVVRHFINKNIVGTSKVARGL